MSNYLLIRNKDVLKYIEIIREYMMPVFSNTKRKHPSALQLNFSNISFRIDNRFEICLHPGINIMTMTQPFRMETRKIYLHICKTKHLRDFLTDNETGNQYKMNSFKQSETHP